MLKRAFAISLACFFLMPALDACAATINTSLSMPQNSLGLVGWWTLDGKDTSWTTGTTRDLSGNGNTGQLISMSTTTSNVPGKMGQAFLFDGASANVAVPNTPSLSPVSAGTVSLWMKWTAPPGSYYAPLAKMNLGADLEGYGFYVRDYDQNVVFDLGSGSSDIELESLGGMNDGKWHQIVGVWDGTTVYTYQDGKPGNNTPQTLTPVTNIWPLLIGADPSGGTQAFPGAIDDVRVYNRALSAAEIQQLYSSGGAKLQANTSDLTNGSSLTKGLVGLWTFDGKDTVWTSDTAATTIDRSGNGNTGTLNGMTQTGSTIPGKLGQGLRFDGTDSFVEVTGNPSSLRLTGSLSISTWVKLNTLSTGGDIRIVDKLGDLNSGYMLANNTDNGPQQFDFYVPTDDNDYLDLYSNTTVQRGVWYHVVTTFDAPSQTGHIYINGVLDDGPNDSLGVHNVTVDNTNNVTIGAKAAGTRTYTLDGSMDETRIYNRALTAAEVKQLYGLSAGKAQTGSSDLTQSSSLSRGLSALWTFDGKDTVWTSGTAATTIDRSGNGNTGTLSGMTQTGSPTPGKMGQALKFDGQTQQVTNSSLTGAADTISFWMRPASTITAVSGELQPLDLANPANGVGPCLGDCFSALTNETIGISNNAVNGGRTGVQNYTFNANTWYHVLFVWNSSASKYDIYINGAKQTTVNNAGTETSEITSASGLIAAHGDDGDGNGFVGTLDDIRIYNRSLSAAEIQQLYALGR